MQSNRGEAYEEEGNRWDSYRRGTVYRLFRLQLAENSAAAVSDADT